MIERVMPVGVGAGREVAQVRREGGGLAGQRGQLIAGGFAGARVEYDAFALGEPLDQ